MPRTETSPEIRTAVLSLSQATSLTQKEIASIVHRNPSTVSRIISRYKTRGTHSSAPQQGRPPKVSPRDKRHLVRNGIRNRFATATQVLDKAGLSGVIIPSRARQIFRMSGLTARRPRKKPFLSRVHRKRRLEWALHRRDWDLDMWKRHIFVDESTFQTGKPDGSILVRRRLGEAYNEDYLIPTFKSGRSTSNHWGAIEYTARSKLVCLRGEGRMTARKYIDNILTGELKDFYHYVYNPLRPEEPPIVVEDNITCHTAGIARAELT